MAALGAILEDAKLEPAFIALTLSPPSEADIAREIGRDVDPDAIFRPARKLRAAIGERLGAALTETYQRMITPGPYRPDAQSAGRRALRNACLDLLATTETSEAIARAFAQYQNADNMTDRMAALETLAQHDRPERTRGARRLLRALRRRSADHRQMACAAGGDPGAGDARPCARADRNIRPFPWPIPIACGR